jgi:hypothetical protein
MRSFENGGKMSQDDMLERELAKLANSGVKPTQAEDELLSQELGKIGANYDGLGGAAIELTAKLLPDDTGQAAADVSASAREVLKTAHEILKREGTLSDKPQRDEKLPTICGVVGSGYLNMNPAVIKVYVAPISENLTRVLVTGSAKEGLIKQYGGKKAAERIMGLIAQAFPASPARSIPAPAIPAQVKEPPKHLATKCAIFISYRRADSADVTGRIYDHLVKHFGQEAIFKDVDSIPLGVDFREYLSESVARCNVFLAIIGKRWLVADNGERRLDSPTDFVRIEIESALQRKIPVVPLLVQGAIMPSDVDLPDSLKPLVYRNATQIRPDPDFHHDISRLIHALEALP